MVDGAVRVGGMHEQTELLKLYVILNTDCKGLEEEKWQRRIARMTKIGLNHPLVVSPHAITRQNDKGWIDTIEMVNCQITILSMQCIFYPPLGEVHENFQLA